MVDIYVGGALCRETEPSCPGWPQTQRRSCTNSPWPPPPHAPASVNGDMAYSFNSLNKRVPDVFCKVLMFHLSAINWQNILLFCFLQLTMKIIHFRWFFELHCSIPLDILQNNHELSFSFHLKISRFLFSPLKISFWACVWYCSFQPACSLSFLQPEVLQILNLLPGLPQTPTRIMMQTNIKRKNRKLTMAGWSSHHAVYSFRVPQLSAEMSFLVD